jgi:hypothetical protein
MDQNAMDDAVSSLLGGTGKVMERLLAQQTVDTVINRAGNFCWKGMRTVACMVDAIYEKGVKLCGSEKRDLERRRVRSAELNWWDISIPPEMVLL